MPAEGALRHGTTAGVQLIETLRWQPDEGFLRLDRHLARLENSARDLGLAYDRSTTRAALRQAVDDAEGMRRVRLTVARHGEAAATAQPFSLQPPETVWRLKLAATRLDANDALLRHKTTRRGAYDRARGEFSPAEADEVLLLNERDEVCEGTITSLFVDAGDGGPLQTPALSCGLLAGVLRAELLASGKAIETVLTVDDLGPAKALFVGNSLRGLIRARLD